MSKSHILPLSTFCTFLLPRLNTMEPKKAKKQKSRTSVHVLFELQRSAENFEGRRYTTCREHRRTSVHVFTAVFLCSSSCSTAGTGWHSTVQCSMVHHITSHHSGTVQCSRDRMSQHRTSHHSTAQHSTVEHSTVEHSTAQHSTAA